MADRQIVDHQQALSVYLRDLLLDVKHETVSSEPTAAETVAFHPITDLAIAAQAVSETVTADWRQAPFKALLLDIHGLQLAIPLNQLCGIREWPETPPPRLPGKPDWYLGLLSDAHQHCQIVDAAHIILPAQHRRNHQSPRYLVLIDDNRWAIACHSVNKVIHLQPEQVKWRQSAGKRPWLAGTVIEQMCSILDINAFVGLLKA